MKVTSEKTIMSQQKLEQFGAYRKALELFDLVVEDMTGLRDIPECWRLIGQQVASADSICANMEEGYGRGSSREFAQFLVISRGSARETSGRYRRFKHWLPEDLIQKRVALCDEIVGILTASIDKLRKRSAS